MDTKPIIERTFSRYEDIIEDSLDSLLINLDYKIISKIFTEDGNIFVKVANINGHKIYILNDLGLKTKRSKNKFILKNTDKVGVSYSFKLGTYNLLNNTTAGVLFELQDGFISTMIRGPELKPVENNYALVDSVILKNKDENSIIVYPIMRLSDIKENPELITVNIDKIIANFKNEQLEFQLQNLQEMFDQIVDIHETFCEFDNFRIDIIEKLNMRLTKLNIWNNLCKTSELVTDDDKNKCNIIRRNLELRNDEATNILRLIGKVTQRKEDLKSISKELRDAVEFMKVNFESVNHQLVL